MQVIFLKLIISYLRRIKKDAHSGHRSVKLLLKVDISRRAGGADTDDTRHRFLVVVALLTSVSQVAYAISHRLNGQDKVERWFNTFLLI